MTLTAARGTSTVAVPCQLTSCTRSTTRASSTTPVASASWRTARVGSAHGCCRWRWRGWVHWAIGAPLRPTERRATGRGSCCRWSGHCSGSSHPGSADDPASSCSSCRPRSRLAPPRWSWSNAASPRNACPSLRGVTCPSMRMPSAAMREPRFPGSCRLSWWRRPARPGETWSATCCWRGGAWRSRPRRRA